MYIYIFQYNCKHTKNKPLYMICIFIFYISTCMTERSLVPHELSLVDQDEIILPKVQRSIKESHKK